MSMYDENQDAGLYDYGQQPQPAEPSPAPASAPTAPQFSPSDAVADSLALLAGDTSKLFSEVLPPNPADSKLPFGLAVFGACIVGIIWANSIDGRGRK